MNPANSIRKAGVLTAGVWLVVVATTACGQEPEYAEPEPAGDLTILPVGERAIPLEVIERVIRSGVASGDSSQLLMREEGDGEVYYEFRSGFHWLKVRKNDSGSFHVTVDFNVVGEVRVVAENFDGVVRGDAHGLAVFDGDVLEAIRFEYTPNGETNTEQRTITYSVTDSEGNTASTQSTVTVEE